MRPPGFWARRSPSLVARALAPLGALYGALAARRMAQPGLRVEAPVVCVGNFVAGGAGKTPAAIAVAQLLREMGERVAFLSRGYGGGRGAGALAVDPGRHRADDVGDEPLLLARAAPCFVARDRRLAARAAIAAGAGVLVLDDGLQSPSLAKDFSFAVVDGGAGFGNGLCLPAGPLRADPVRQLLHVSAVIFVDGVSDASIKAYETVSGAPLFNARLEPDPAVAARLCNQNVLAFAGIGRPEKFFNTLRALGARVVVARAFADHQRYSGAELDALFAEAASLGLTPVTTQKDLVRLAPDRAEKVVALPVVLRFDDAPAVKALLGAALARRRAEPAARPREIA
ncbi:MAG: tetraacyldisaccharide 4'-kinase [Roseiarcus sp.]